ANVERDFRSIKAIDLDLRPIQHHTETRVKAHVFTCMLAAYLTWHLRKAWAPLTFTDEHRPEPEDPVVAAQRSTDAYKKASTRALPDGRPAHSFQPLLRHLATLTRQQTHITYAHVPTSEVLADPAPDAAVALRPDRVACTRQPAVDKRRTANSRRSAPTRPSNSPAQT